MLEEMVQEHVRQLAVTNDNGDSVSWRRARRVVRNGNGIVVERERRRSKGRVGDRGRGKDIGKARGRGGGCQRNAIAT